MVDRPPFASGDWFDGTTEDYVKEATSYIAYSGPLHVDEDKRTRTHSRFVSLFPNWTGQTQPRAVLASDAAKSISGQTIPIDGDSKAAE